MIILRKNSFLKAAVVPLCLLLLVVSCSKDIDPGDPASAVDGLARAQSPEEKKVFFTSDTQNLLHKAESHDFVNPWYFLSLLHEDAEWLERERSVEGDTAGISIVITSHPVENLTGAGMDFKLKKEDGKWKIDLTDELETALSASGDEGAAYIRGLRP